MCDMTHAGKEALDRIDKVPVEPQPRYAAARSVLLRIAVEVSVRMKQTNGAMRPTFLQVRIMKARYKSGCVPASRS